MMLVDPRTRSATRRERIVRLVCLAVALASAGALFLVTPGNASASSSASSSLTVAWANDSSSAASDQPTRSTTSVHYSSLKNIKVTVDQTQGVQDQAIGVHVTGFAATRGATDFGGTVYTDAMNFMQAMECWGDPASPTFAQTCEWGGRYGPNNGLGNSVYGDTIMRVPPTDIAPPTCGDAARPDPDPLDVPFLTVQKILVTGHQNNQCTLNADGKTYTSSITYPLFDYFNTSTSNEIESARMDSAGDGSFDFEAQNSDDAPEMGCGTAAHLRCWLVLVPRDTIYGGKDANCSQILDNSFDAYTYGRTNSIQAGSPVNPSCDYWDNRMVVPLDFNPTGNNCASGNTERGIGGSQLMVGAMASWQPELCADLKTTYSFVANPDSVARTQVVEQQSGMAFTSYPITPDGLTDDDKTALSTTQLSYAPVAATSSVFAFIAEGTNGRIDTLNLSPRLVAKLLTQSYKFTVPANSGDPASDELHLPAINRRYELWSQDPDFQAINPNWKQFTTNPALVLPGPASADAISQLWKWIDADSDAQSWLAGNPDQWGMTINPYYLPKGDPNAEVPTFTPQGVLIPGVLAPVGLSNLDGTPMQIGKVAQSTFIKADGTLVPLALQDAHGTPTVRYPFGSNQFAPYAAEFLSAARSAFRANPGSLTVWDGNQIDPAGDKGAWVSGGPQIPGQRFTIAFTDAASAQRYDLSDAALTADNSPTIATGPTDAAVSSALSNALVVTSNPGVQQVDPSKAKTGDYPLAALVYASVNLTSSDAGSRKDYANFINEVTTKGQTQGVQVGQLPPGYVPLSSTLAGQAAAAATAISTFVPGTTSSGAGTALTYGNSSSSGANGAGSPGKAGAGLVSSTGSSEPRKTPSSPAPGGQSALLACLGTGLAGSIFAPALLRRRRFT